MPSSTPLCAAAPRIPSDGGPLRSLKNEEFDQVFPEAIGKVSSLHWSPVHVCRTAAQLLVIQEGTRVLDIGCGPGKFCVIGATTTQGRFTGVEQRGKLARIAQDVVRKHSVPNVAIVHCNIQEVSFRDFDAFYLFNPFQENILPMLRIDHEVEVNPGLYSDYTTHVRQQLRGMPTATRVVTYCGDCVEIPASYLCVKTAFHGQLKLWVKS